ncbi:hypothetical protein KDW_19870 [Dictyobacter vulcani]|uniref:L,D-TPase catalytic domain-containing protein n=1 Tax=Dictyobacter vulcani TaxID=2607529 RepID=A0A5J4KJ47_9CHLR|nr:L,D-transpeptidase [Dictyobacter vulcani]GER87825.1 hypothetical protein KDW_19870 [Dictyobacter vulcani]
MGVSYPVLGRARMLRLVVGLVLVMAVLSFSSCEGDAQVRQRAMESEQRFVQLLHSARQLGFPQAVLQPILQQDAFLRSTQPPFSLFSSQPLNAYYQGREQRYALLHLQLQGLMATTTQRLRSDDVHELQSVRSLLTRENKAGLPAANFSVQVDQLQHSLADGQSFTAYTRVHQDVQHVARALQMLQATSLHLQTLQGLVDLTQRSRLDTALIPLQAAYQDNKLLFQHAARIEDLQLVDHKIAVQQQQAEATLLLAMPAVTGLRVHELDEGIQQLPAVHLDAKPYQVKLAGYKKRSAAAMSLPDFRQFLRQVDGDIFAVKADALREDANQAISAFHQDVNAWSGSHLYYDDYDGNSYALDISYLNQNFGLNADVLLEQATTLDALQNARDVAKTLLFNHRLMELDAVDPTPYYQVHQADLQALQHYQLQLGQVIVISLSRQSLRLYQDGRLVQAFLVTTGRPERPSPPGVWTVLNRLSPTLFKSNDPPTSPFWYPKTIIQTAVLFREGGYFIHDSWWRANYGPGTEFPHYDDSGDQRSSGNGSHGCVNLPPDQAAWIYYNTGWSTSIVIY